jgi:hypothetical protein
MLILCAAVSSAQSEATRDNQINVNWFYGSYVPKEVPLESLDRDERFRLYIRHN